MAQELVRYQRGGLDSLVYSTAIKPSLVRFVDTLP
jgi:hypothetical protein